MLFDRTMTIRNSQEAQFDSSTFFVTPYRIEVLDQETMEHARAHTFGSNPGHYDGYSTLFQAVFLVLIHKVISDLFHIRTVKFGR
jgi:hypothetical protein